MKTDFNRIVGVSLIAAAIIGLVFSVVGLGSVWYFKFTMAESLVSNIRLIRSTLKTTADGLTLMQASLDSASISLQALQNTLDTTAEAIQSSQPVLDSVVKLMKDDLPNTITATQSSLAAAQESAEVIDSVLNALSFLPGIDYNPEVPLHVALGKVSESLNDLPGTFTEMQASLKDAGRNMEVIQADLPVVAEQIGQIEASMTGYKAIIKSYQDSLAELQKRLAKSEANLPALLTFLALALTIFFLWMAVAQLGLFMQGRELLLHQKQEKEQPAEKDPAGNDKSSEPHAGGVL